MAESRRPFRELTTLRTVVIGLVTLMAGLVALYFGNDSGRWQRWPALQPVVNEVGALLIVSVALGVVWELVGKRAFSREILETARVAADVEDSGLVTLGSRFTNSPDWDHLFREANNLDVFVAYASTWRHTHADKIRDLLRRGGRVRIYLPDPADSINIAALAERFQTTPTELINRISTAAREFYELGDGLRGSINVLHFAGDPVFTLYRFDHVAVIAFYKHRRGIVDFIPTIVCRAGGWLYEFAESELDAINASASPASRHFSAPAQGPGQP